MKKFFSNQSNSWVVLPVCTLAITCHLIHSAQAVPSQKIVPVSNLGSRLTTGPTLPPPVDENLRIATGPTLPPPVDENLRITVRSA